MLCSRAPRCPLARLVLLCQALLAVVSSRGTLKCQEQSVSVNGTLWLQPEEPPKEWVRVEWRVMLDSRPQRILTAENGIVKSPNNSFHQRVSFEEKTLSLQISPVGTNDSGVYKAEFENREGVFTALCFNVWVWAPVQPPHLEKQILLQDQGWCNLSLICSVLGAGNISYNWSCPGDVPEPHPQLFLRVHKDSEPSICGCNASNPVSWSMASTDVVAECRAAASGLSSIITWWAVAVSLGLALAISTALVVTCYCRRTQRQDSPGHVEQTLTVYEEVGKAQPTQDPNGTSDVNMGGNTIYAVVCNRAQQRPRPPQEPQSCTIYSTVQVTRKSPSLKRKRLDPALVSTAYVEDTRASRLWCPPFQTTAPSPASLC
ncbi:natural killer cell receptor 2B4 isoform X1 [Colius striatus]|uniref:natural killer cell receptor 2B4 isoform X1 n=1 Tax=Colius striatus TaxID=57412 RepID=UPI002B1CECB9|nr:natural killer cell receptor 2B4 isoform X1 [Colius striatus]